MWGTTPLGTFFGLPSVLINVFTDGGFLTVHRMSLAGPGGETRTPDPMLPKHVPYQTGLHPDLFHFLLSRLILFARAFVFGAFTLLGLNGRMTTLELEEFLEFLSLFLQKTLVQRKHTFLEKTRRLFVL